MKFIERSIKNDINIQYLSNFYKDISYKAYREVDSESNIRTTIEKVIEDNYDKIQKKRGVGKSKKIILNLIEDNEMLVKWYYIDEAMFNLYKSISICLEGFNICESGVQGWAYTTRYYSQYYLGISVLSFTGNFAQFLFPEQLKNNGMLEELKGVLDTEEVKIFGKKIQNKKIQIETDVEKNKSILAIEKGGLKCHKWVGEMYNNVLRKQFILPDILPTFMIGDDFICSSMMRNNETYGRDGFLELQYYNKSPEEFIQNYKEVDDSDLEELEEMWGFICSIMKFYKSIEIEELPLEEEKIIFLIESIVKNEEIKNDLTDIMKRT